MTEIEHMEVEANGVLFRVAASGPPDGPQLLCLHGFPEGSMSWHAVMRQLTGVRVYAPDLRGYPGTIGGGGDYDVFTITDDVKALIDVLGLHSPTLAGHDWGGALAWLFAHRYSELIDRLVVINCTHPKTLARAILPGEDFQPLRVPWLYFFELPRLPEWFMTTDRGRAILRWSFLVREGTKGAMDRELVDELVGRFQHPRDFAGPLGYYRAF